MPAHKQPATADARQQQREAQHALDSLKTLLIEPEQRQLKALQSRLDNPVAYAEEVAQILPQALRRSKDTDLAQALERPLTQSILRAARREPRVFAEAVFPILGPAIRRAIAESMRGMVRKINRMLDHSFSMRGLGWRWEALRSGVTFSEVVLRHTLEYRVEQVFLIRPEDGALIAYVSDQPGDKQDPDAYSAMLNAIQSFYKDTIDATESVSAVQLVEHTALLVHGPLAYIACVVDGEPIYELRNELADILAEIHARYSDKLKSFSGDTSDMDLFEPELERCLLTREKESAKSAGLSRPMVVLLMAVLAAAAWFGFKQWQDQKARQAEYHLQSQAISLLHDIPGVVLTDIDRSPGRLHLHGMRDPLAEDPLEVLSAAGLTVPGLEALWHSYQSTELALAQRRARQRLAPPADVSLSLDENLILIARGTAPRTWIQKAQLLATTIPGVEGFDDSQLIDSDQLLYDQTYAQILELKSSIEDTRLKFEAGSSKLSEQHHSSLERIAEEFKALLKLAGDLNSKATLRVIGRTDGVGSARQNQAVSYARANEVSLALNGLGIARSAIQPNAQPQSSSANIVADPELRRIEFTIEMTDPAPHSDSSSRPTS